jgi:hypothetical protein
MTTQAPNTVAWPLIFTYRGTILGKGFVANIEFQGRVLACPESTGVWVYGVNPGAIAVSAPTLEATNIELRKVITQLFIDFAQEAPTFGRFKAAVEEFVHESDSDSDTEWQNARLAVKDGRVATPSDLPKDHAEATCSVTVTEKPMAAVTAADNLLVQEESAPLYGMAA